MNCISSKCEIKPYTITTIIGSFVCLAGIALLLASFKLPPTGVNVVNSWMPSKIIAGVLTLVGAGVVGFSIFKSLKKEMPIGHPISVDLSEEEVRHNLEKIIDPLSQGYLGHIFDKLVKLAHKKKITAFQYEHVLIADLRRSGSRNIFEPDGPFGVSNFRMSFDGDTNKKSYLVLFWSSKRVKELPPSPIAQQMIKEGLELKNMTEKLSAETILNHIVLKT